MKRVTLELGGKSANIVFADADLAAAAASAPYAVFDNAGQDCCARSRILVERSAYDEFLGRLEPAVAALRVLDPADEASEMGPLISAAPARPVQGFLDEARSPSPAPRPGGRRLLGAAERGPHRRPSEPVWREEVFGPVVAVMPFDDEAHAVALANDTEYGLSGLDLHPRPRPRAAGRAGRRGRQPQRQLALRGALLDAVRRLQAVRPRPRARPRRAARVHRGEERLPRPLTDPHAASGTRRTHTWQDASTARSPSSPAAARGSGWRPCAASSRRAPRSSIGDIDDAARARAGRPARRRRRRDVRPRRRHQQGRGRRALRARQGHLRLGRHRLQQRRHLARRRTTRSSTPTSRPGGGCRRST